jgi:hypothetical protein
MYLPFKTDTYPSRPSQLGRVEAGKSAGASLIDLKTRRNLQTLVENGASLT